MADAEPAVVTKSSRTSTGEGPALGPFERAKRQLVLACALIGGGLAIAGSLDRTTGGVALLAGWLLAVAALHRLGRTGSERGTKRASS